MSVSRSFLVSALVGVVFVLSLLSLVCADPASSSAAPVSAPVSPSTPSVAPQELAPRKIQFTKEKHAERAAAHAGSSSVVPITLHTSGTGGGLVMTAPVKVYMIYYGAWTGTTTNPAVLILADLITGMSASTWYTMTKQYYQGSATKVYASSTMTLAGQVFIPAVGATADGSYGAGPLTDTHILQITQAAIAKGGFGSTVADPNGIYLVLTSNEITKVGFCTDYCGWHSAQLLTGSSFLKYGFIGNPATQCASSCGATTPSANGNAGADAMASIIAHELTETITDPVNAWWDSNGWENGDKCAWKYGTTSLATNGARYNTVIAGRKFLIQQNWKLLPSQMCDLKA